MNILKAVAVSEDMTIKIERFTWDLSNCRGNVSLISHQLYLLNPSGCDLYLAPRAAFIYCLGQDYVNFEKVENQSTFG